MFPDPQSTGTPVVGQCGGRYAHLLLSPGASE
jgi:hypothetical protein